MTPEQATELRKPFGPESVGKLPRITCRSCRDAQAKNCGDHRKIKCAECGNWITTAHLHLDYVGHAEITDRLLAVDPQWTWEPAAVGADGLPQMGHGGLWIRLTVAGVTRIGFGSADGKTGPDAVKEMIGDALRNAAMRFGVGLDLWGAKYKEDGQQYEPHREPEPEQDEPSRQPAERHESSWDPDEQKMLLVGWQAEIDKADSAAISEIGKKILEAKRAGSMSPNTYRKLATYGGKRKAELDAEPKGDTSDQT